MRCDFDNRQGRSFPENAFVQQAGKHSGACTVSTESNAEQLLILQDGRACQLRRGGQRARYVIHHQAGGIEVPLEKFGYGWVKVHNKVSAVLKKRLLERGADPNRLSDTPVAIISDHIKAARMVRPFRKRLQKQLRAAHYFRLFFERHATGGITEA